MPATRRAYLCDVTDAEWQLPASVVPPPAGCGRPRKWSDRLTRMRCSTCSEAMIYGGMSRLMSSRPARDAWWSNAPTSQCTVTGAV